MPWAELHCHSSFSFLDGACDPEVLAAEASALGTEAIALTDHDGMYGVMRLHQAARELGIATILGAELSLGPYPPARRGGAVPVPDPPGEHLLVLARNLEGYRRLSRAITAAQLAGEKGRPVYDWERLAAAHDGQWAVLTGCRKGAVPAALAAGGPEAATAALRRLQRAFGPENVFVELIDHDQPLDDARNDALFALARRAGAPVVASNNVHYAGPRQAPLAQALAAVRARGSLDGLAGWLPATGTAHPRSGAEMAARLARFDGVLDATVALGRACAFDVDLVAPGLPLPEVPPGHTEGSWLRALVADGAEGRYGPPGAERVPGVYQQLERELAVIEELRFPGYFLIVHDIVRFCREKDILCQGRGSAANSAVCYALGITSVEPLGHRLLFERFLSTGRDGPPDIDLDIEHRRRELVIQYVYDRYGREHAAQVANVISYRPRLALRDAARALGHSPGRQDAWARRIDAYGSGRHRSPHDDPRPGADGRDGAGTPAPQAADADGDDIPAQVLRLAEGFHRLPRHLGIHSGGMVLCDRPVAEVCPVEWARMPGRSVLQWDKDDCAAAGLVKFDLLGLGMLSALHDTFDLIEAAYGHRLALHTLPQEDAAVYDMLCDADTVGVFQVESRAQMATLPRLRPREFYDLVVEVSLIRPGPIQGGSVHPYLRRRHGDEKSTPPHPLMENALARTLGVPLFQEQMMQLAIDCAGFSPTEADHLRLAMSAKRAPERMQALRGRLLDGMAAHGIPPQTAEDIYAKLLGFASYGFPESHAISFAYLVYASAYLKRHYPAAFTAALLRNQPMGFYSPATLVEDARRHGVVVRPVDVNASAAQATLEPLERGGAEEPSAPPDAGRRWDSARRPPHVRGPARHSPTLPQPAIRLGIGSVRDVGAEAARRVAAGRPYTGVEDLAARTGLSTPALEALAVAGALGCFGPSRRAALWSAGAVARIRPGQLPGFTPGADAPALPEMSVVEETFADLWATGIAAVHPVAHVRDTLEERGAVTAAVLHAIGHGTNVTVGGLVTHRQRPPTAGGVVFMNLEDETGMVNVVCPPPVWERFRRIALDAAAVVVRGRVERQDGATNLVAYRLERLRVVAAGRSRDFR